MSNSENKEKKSKPGYKRPSVWLVVGIIALIFLLFIWSDIVDMFGGGADMILPWMS